MITVVLHRIRELSFPCWEKEDVRTEVDESERLKNYETVGTQQLAKLKILSKMGNQILTDEVSKVNYKLSEVT